MRLIAGLAGAAMTPMLSWNAARADQAALFILFMALYAFFMVDVVRTGRDHGHGPAHSKIG